MIKLVLNNHCWLRVKTPVRITQDDEVITPFNSGSPCDSVIETIWEFCFYLPEYEDWLCFTEYACVSKSEVIDPGGDDGGGDPVDPVDPGEPGGGTPPVGDDIDPCDELGGGDDDDGTGGGDSDEDFAPPHDRMQRMQLTQPARKLSGG